MPHCILCFPFCILDFSQIQWSFFLLAPGEGCTRYSQPLTISTTWVLDLSRVGLARLLFWVTAWLLPNHERSLLHGTLLLLFPEPIISWLISCPFNSPWYFAEENVELAGAWLRPLPGLSIHGEGYRIAWLKLLWIHYSQLCFIKIIKNLLPWVSNTAGLYAVVNFSSCSVDNYMHAVFTNASTLHPLTLICVHPFSILEGTVCLRIEEPDFYLFTCWKPLRDAHL